MRGEQAIFNLENKKKSGLRSINPNIHHSKIFSSGWTGQVKTSMRPVR